jgi:rare lipoprotein A
VLLLPQSQPCAFARPLPMLMPMSTHSARLLMSFAFALIGCMPRGPACQCPVCPACEQAGAACSSPQPPAAAKTAPASPRSTSPARTEIELLAQYEGQAPTRVLEGKATYYGDSLAGNKTANGDVYDPRGFTAAHRTLPFNTIVRVVRLDTQRYVYVRINDRGPFGNAQRIIDVSKIAAERLGMLRAGVVRVRVEVLE